MCDRVHERDGLEALEACERASRVFDRAGESAHEAREVLDELGPSAIEERVLARGARHLLFEECDSRGAVQAVAGAWGLGENSKARLSHEKNMECSVRSFLRVGDPA